MKPYYPLTIPEIPASNYVYYPMRGLGGSACDDTWTQYEKNRAEYDALASRLTGDAADCAAKKSRYAEDRAAYDAAVAASDACRRQSQAYETELARSQTIKAEYDACAAKQAVYLKEKAAYEAVLLKYKEYLFLISKQNEAAKAKYEQLLASYRSAVAAAGSKNSALMAAYNTQLAQWNTATKNRAGYLAAISAMAAGYGTTWSLLQKQYPSLTNYTPPLASVCGSNMICLNASGRAYYASKCSTVLKGLGATALPSLTTNPCMMLKLPDCPTACPTFYPDPGPAPAKPVLIEVGPGPIAPVMVVPDTLEAFLAKSGAKAPAPETCSLPQVPVAPSPVSCAVLVPQQPVDPGCSVPSLPEPPVAPTCKRGSGCLTPFLIAAAAAAAVTILLPRRR